MLAADRIEYPSGSTRPAQAEYAQVRVLGTRELDGIVAAVLPVRLQRSAGRGLTKFIGRQHEMDAMKAATKRAKSGHGQIVAAMHIIEFNQIANE